MELDVYTKKGIFQLLDNDEIEDYEQGFLEGYFD